MGIENDRLVFDYLSRIGDLAQQRQVPAAERRELVTGLRDEIERRRAERGEGVRGILGDLGTPDEVVGRVVPGPRAGAEAQAEASEPPIPPPARSAPARAVPVPRAGDWWHGDAADEADATGAVPGFMGGVEIPEILKPPPEEPEDGGSGDSESEDPEAPDGSDPRGRLSRLRGLRLGSPLLLFAAALLLLGVVLGHPVPVLAGWLLAYASRERRVAALALPGAVAAGGAIWLWGRVTGRWGAPIPPGEEALGAALSATWPWTLRTAAIASALYLLWRSRRS
ncbi:hypothetical protein [Streptomyces sp. NPDC048623]|uniref:hypothetical protein n=1 Tax=Streptomyces sp. NPDC048623 TaxID=3155761 RepID=UPI003438D8AE